MYSAKPGKRAIALIIAGAVALTACGSGDDTGSSSDTTVVGDSDASDTTDPGDVASGDDTAGREPGWAGELTIGSTEGASLDPVRIASLAGGDLDRPAAIFGTLLIARADGSYEGELAESMTTEDGITWTIKLRPDVTFTDGTTLDAEAVKFNLERQMDPENPFSAAGNLADVASIEVVDDLTIVITLNEQNGTFWEGFAIANGLIGSPTAIKADPIAFAASPVGAGPYIMTESVRDSYSILERNPDYAGLTQPNYETIRVQMYPDPLARAEALRAGEVDLAYSAGVATLNQLGDPAAAGLEVRTANGASFVALNHSRGPAQDVRVREAISIAFDPVRVRDAVLGGVWDELQMVCPPFDVTAPECVPGLWPEFDQERAKELISEYAAEGNSVEATLLATTNSQGEGEFIQQALNAIGLDITLDVLPGAEWLPRINAGEYDMSWYAFAAPVGPRIFDHFRSEGRNIIQANYPDFDEAVVQARTALDPAEQQAGWTKAQELFATQFQVAFYAPYRDGYIFKEGIDLGDQLTTIWIHLSLVAPAE